jgi:2-C-methyl-D-erythritol 2,4-cyclodiphosphate synthase
MSFVDDMRNAISEFAGITADQISIKATTSEKIGFVGREEGANAYAVALITKA